MESINDGIEKLVAGHWSGSIDTMNWKRMLAYVTGTVDEELLARNEYLVTENRILRGQIKGRIRLTDPEHINLASAAKQLTRKALKKWRRSSDRKRFLPGTDAWSP